MNERIQHTPEDWLSSEKRVVSNGGADKFSTELLYRFHESSINRLFQAKFTDAYFYGEHVYRYTGDEVEPDLFIRGHLLGLDLLLSQLEDATGKEIDDGPKMVSRAFVRRIFDEFKAEYDSDPSSDTTPREQIYRLSESGFEVYEGLSKLFRKFEDNEDNFGLYTEEHKAIIRTGFGFSGHVVYEVRKTIGISPTHRMDTLIDDMHSGIADFLAGESP